MMEFPYQQYAVDCYAFKNALTDPAFRARVAETVQNNNAILRRMMETSLYGEAVQPPKRTWREAIHDTIWRIRDAWAVLIGKAEIT